MEADGYGGDRWFDSIYDFDIDSHTCTLLCICLCRCEAQTQETSRTAASRCKDKFGSLLIIGIVAQIGLQVVLNILVVTDTLPNTGFTFPFFSYGGTAIFMLLFEIGVVLSISRKTNQQKV